MTERVFKVGSRASTLAMTQTEYVLGLIRQTHPGVRCEVISVTTAGDADRVTALSRLGGRGLFTRKIEQELLDGRIDLAVHSAKDLPSTMTDGLTIGAVPPRERCEDVWIARDGQPFAGTRHGAVVGTGSPRRRAQILRLRPDFEMKEIRGNVETRLRKLREGQYDALVMARAGLRRSGLENEITEVFSTAHVLPAAGQGALLVQRRGDDADVLRILASLDDSTSHLCLLAERELLARLGAGCSAPVGCLATVSGDAIKLAAVVLDAEGTKAVRAEASGAVTTGYRPLVEQVAESLLAQGAGQLIEAAHE
jgi:hydroxymethylbilane synthase